MKEVYIWVQDLENKSLGCKQGVANITETKYIYHPLYCSGYRMNHVWD